MVPFISEGKRPNSGRRNKAIFQSHRSSIIRSGDD